MKKISISSVRLRENKGFIHTFARKTKVSSYKVDVKSEIVTLLDIKLMNKNECKKTSQSNI